MNDAVVRLNNAVKEFFAKNKDVSIAIPKDIVPFLKNNNDEMYSDDREGLPVRHLLRKLEKKGSLSDIPCCYFEQKGRNKNWYFAKTTKK